MYHHALAGVVGFRNPMPVQALAASVETRCWTPYRQNQRARRHRNPRAGLIHITDTFRECGRSYFGRWK